MSDTPAGVLLTIALPHNGTKSDAGLRVTMIDAILTDLDGVVRTWSANHDKVAEQAAGMPEGEILRVALSNELLSQAVTGKITDEDWRSRICAILSNSFPSPNVERAMAIWSESAGEVNTEVVAILKACRSRPEWSS